MKRLQLTWLLCFAWSSLGHAQSPADLERAKRSFRAGANAYAAGDYLAAIQALELAYELTPLPALAFSLAQAERKQYFVDSDRRHLERAIELFQRYLEQLPRGPRREDAKLALLQLEPLRGNSPAPVREAPELDVRPTRLMIVSDVPGARIALDGQEPAPSPLIREVTPGRHRASVQAFGFYDAEREVTAVAGELILSEVRLIERPSSLFVSAPAGADVYVDGEFRGRGGRQPLMVPLQTGSHRVLVARKGYELERRTVQVARGRNESLEVTLVPTVQRAVSELLFIGGGAALGASLVLSAFAIQSENQAEAFLGKRARGNAGSAQLVSYNASLNDRNRFRAATAVSLAASAGFFITGLFLHELDEPSLQTARPFVGAVDPPLRRREQRASALTVLPSVSPHDVGAALHFAF